MEVVSVTQVRPSRLQAGRGVTKLSCCDSLYATTCFASAYAFPGGRVDAGALEAALQRLVDDLPFLGGRLKCLDSTKLASLAILHDGPGLTFSVADAPSLSLADVGPHTWPSSAVTLAQPGVPAYFDPTTTSRQVLKGEGGAVMKVRLVRLEDGDLLSIAVSHTITDLTRWNQLVGHLVALYRHESGGPEPAPGELLQPSDRTLMSSEHLACILLGEDHKWQPPKEKLRPTLAGYWKILRLMRSMRKAKLDMLLLHLPERQVQRLKRLAQADQSGGGPCGTSAITTGDAVQAACALLVHAAQRQPLLPVAPAQMVIMVQLPTPEGYYGNATQMLPVSLPRGTKQPGAGAFDVALAQLASAIRGATTAFRASPEAQLEALSSQKRMTQMPALKMVACMASLPVPTCITNYVPKQQDPVLGLGVGPLFTQHIVVPYARAMAAVRPAPAAAPYGGGLLVQLCLSHEAAGLMAPVLRALLPEATVLGRRDGK